MTHTNGGDIISLVFLNYICTSEVQTVNSVSGNYSMEYFVRLVLERCGMQEFLKEMHMSEKRFIRIACGTCEATQSEMLRTAAVLDLSEAEFMRCFFSK